jgi:hypothetical protein
VTGEQASPPTGHFRVWARSLFTLPPAPGPRWPIALQAALSMFLPVALFTALGHPEIGLQAAGGAFTAIYLAWASPARRVRLLPLIGCALLACAAIGAVVAPFPVAAATGLVVLSILAGALHYGYRLGPPGPIFFVLVYGLATHVTSIVDGRRLVEPLPFLGAVTAGAAIAYAIAVVAFLLMRKRSGGIEPPMPRIPRLDAEARALLIRVAIVAVAGTLLSVLLVDAERAYWTVTAGLAVIGVNAGRRVAFIRGSQRLVGTIVGAMLFAGLAFIPIPVYVLPFLLGALQFAIEMLVVRNYALALVFITPLVLIITSTAAGGSGGVADQLVWERVLDTLVGATLGAVTGIVHPRADRRGQRA